MKRKLIEATIRKLMVEDDELTNRNYYQAAKAIILEYDDTADRTLTYALIYSGVKRMYKNMPDAQGFLEHSRSRDIFNRLKPRLEELGKWLYKL